MEISETGFRDLLIIKPDVYGDARGYFFESFNRKLYGEKGIEYNFVQDNQSRSTFGVIRGLHYQLEPYSQAKLIRVLLGSIYDVVVDIRKGAPTFGQWYGLELSSENYLQLMIPAGFAHGFSVLSPEAVVLYKTDAYYNPASERGILYNDVTLGIDWKIDARDIKVSAKDCDNPPFTEAASNFTY